MTEWQPLWEMSPSAEECAENPDFSFLVPSGPPTGWIHMRAVSKGAWGQAQCPWYRAEDGEDRGQRLLWAGYGMLACILSHRMASLVAQTVKNLSANAGDPGTIHRLGRSPGEEHGNPLLYSILPGEFCGQRRLAGYSPWNHKESDLTERLTLPFPSP